MNLQKTGGLAVWLLALTYVAGIALNFTVLDTSSLADPSDRLRFLVEHRWAFGGFILGAYVAFGCWLVVGALAIHARFGSRRIDLSAVAMVFAVVWATLLMGSGLVYLAGLQAAADLIVHDPTGAVALWRLVDVIHQGLGCVVEIPGGLWILLTSFHGGKISGFPRGLVITGTVVGACGIASVVPLLFMPAVGLYVISSSIWFVWMGILLRRSSVTSSERPFP